MLHTCANTLVDRIYEHCANSLEGIAQTHEEKVKAAVIRKSVDPEFLRTVGNLLEKDTTIQTRDRGKSYVTYPTDYVLNDTTTTTTQVEVFRAKVDRNDPIDYFKLPPDPLGPDQRPMIVRAVGPPYEVQTRTETRFSDRPVTSRPGSRVQWESETDLRSIGHGADSTLSRRSQIGSGAGQYPQIGSGVGYHQPRIGSGTSLDQRIGSGTSLNQPRIGSGTSLNQPRIGSGAEIDRPRIGSGASYNSPSPNIGYGTSAGYPLRRVGSDFDWEERRFVGPNELTSYERSRSQSPITVDPTRPSYGLRDTDTYTATILRKQWTEDRDQRIQHKDNLGRRRSPSPPSGADATTYPPRIGNGVEAKRQPRQLHHTKSHQDVFQDPKRRYDYPPDYQEDFRREYTTREIQKPGIQSSFSEGYERRRRESRSPDRSYIQQDQYRTRTYSPAGERYRDAHGSRKNQYDRDPPRDHHYHRSRRHSKSPDRYRRVSPRARSETRLQQQEAEGQSYRRVQNPYRAQGPTSTSPYSTLSRPRSREDATETYDLKLYQTRDCLGNILYNL
uniref:Uncharacterized protein n=1 Tax=Acrobeloides nanus TaxID=290746 RepID=A0A914CLQ2_9BILA